jgi:hypothetical protein
VRPAHPAHAQTPRRQRREHGPMSDRDGYRIANRDDQDEAALNVIGPGRRPTTPASLARANIGRSASSSMRRTSPSSAPGRRYRLELALGRPALGARGSARPGSWPPPAHPDEKEARRRNIGAFSIARGHERKERLNRCVKQGDAGDSTVRSTTVCYAGIDRPQHEKRKR